MLQTITKLQAMKIMRMITKRPVYLFGGGGHHEIDRSKIQLRNDESGYYLDPNETARRIMRVISQNDKVEDPEKMTLNSQWHELGLNELDTVQLLIGIEEEFKIQFPDDISEKFKDIHDVVQYVSRSFWAA